MKRDLFSGIVLILGALIGVGIMAAHPTAHDIAGSGSPEAQAHLNVVVHSIAIAGLPLTFLGLIGLARRLGPSDLTNVALVAWGFGSVAGMGAAVASGFVASPLLLKLAHADGAAKDILHNLLQPVGLMNQGFAKVYVVAVAAGMLAWGLAIVRSGRMSKVLGFAAVLVGLAVLVAVVAVHMKLDVHGFGLVTLVESAWLVAVGGALMRGEPS
ncbi:MAG TPA: hypothetical protein VF139_15155 [Candidatus Polarisedimenticolaceae bacterium]